MELTSTLTRVIVKRTIEVVEDMKVAVKDTKAVGIVTVTEIEKGRESAIGTGIERENAIVKGKEAEETGEIETTISTDETIETEIEVSLKRETRVEVVAAGSTTTRKMTATVTGIEKMVSDVTSELKPFFLFVSILLLLYFNQSLLH